MKVFMWSRRHALRATFIALFAVLVSGAAVCVTGSSAVAAAPSDGFVRLAHLSPDTPDVDVYLDALSFKMKEQVFHGVGYGTMSAYLTLPAGTYAVKMRPSGASPTTPPVITTNVKVVAGHAYTVAGVGKHANLGLAVIPDDLSNPLNGQAEVRIVQASIRAPHLDVSVSGGAPIATNVPFATTTSYRSVAPGALTLEVGPTGGTPIPLTVTLKPNSVYSILVLDGKDSLTAELRTDAESKGTPPKGSVATGGGGMSRGRFFLPAAYIAGAALVLMLLIAFRRRGLDRWTTRRMSRHPRRLPSRSL